VDSYDVVILGAGPAGLAAGLAAYGEGASTLIIERENRPGGILKQCIHDGFGLINFGERLSGPEYAERYIKMVKEKGISILTSTFAIKVIKGKLNFELELVNKEKGVFNIIAKSIVLANGCRERTSKQVYIHGTRPAGIYSAGTAQYFVNMLGYLPCKKCVILGSGDIGLIMARRLTLEGAKVVGVYEAKSTPSGLSRNIAQCLKDYDIPLYLSHTVTRVIGDERVEAVEISEVDDNMQPIEETEKIIECDGVILSVGLIPENDIAETLNVKIDKATKGPVVDQSFMTMEKNIFSCGNALHVNDLVDYVSESGKYAGRNAARYSKTQIERKPIPVKVDLNDFLYIVPQCIDIKSQDKEAILYFRTRNIRKNILVKVMCRNKTLFKKRYRSLRPPEMEKIKIDISNLDDHKIEELEIQMLEG
jgi:thioredoxin reductase